MIWGITGGIENVSWKTLVLVSPDGYFFGGVCSVLRETIIWSIFQDTHYFISFGRTKSYFTVPAHMPYPFLFL